MCESKEHQNAGFCPRRLASALAESLTRARAWRLLSDPRSRFSTVIGGTVSATRERPLRRLTTTSLILVAVLIAAVGVLLLYLGELTGDWWTRHPSIQALVRDLGALLIVSAAIGVIWDLVGKRSFAREVLETARTSTDVEAAGLVRIGTNYVDEPDWEALFATVRKLDIFLAYGSTWRNTHLEKLRKLAQSGGRIRVYLPDPDGTVAIAQLADRFDKAAADLLNLIDEARRAYQAIPSSAGGSVEVFFRSGDAVFSCYRFDGTAVLTLYTHRRQRTGVPTIVCRDGGSLYQFVRDEFTALQEQSRPAPTGTAPSSTATPPAPPPNPTGSTP